MSHVDDHPRRWETYSPFKGQRPLSVMSWTPQAVLANVSFRTAIEAAPAAFVPPGDARVETVSAIHPIHAEFLRRFTDPFGERVHPMSRAERNQTKGRSKTLPPRPSG